MTGQRIGPLRVDGFAAHQRVLHAPPSLGPQEHAVLVRDAVLLRVLPISELEQKWVFPQEEFENVELSMIDANGDYIIKGHSFKNSSFFEFYRSYNRIEPAAAQELFGRITSSTGSFSMFNSRGEECILAYTPVAATEGWSLLSFMPMKDLRVNTENWLLIGFVSAGLLILFVFDMAVMLNINKKLQTAAREAASANRAKTDFLSTMSHDKASGNACGRSVL